MLAVYKCIPKLLSVAICIGSLSSIAYGQAVKYVAITSIVEHPALNSVRKGVEDELKASGYIPGKNIKFEFQSAQGNSATAAQIAKKFTGSKPDSIVAIGTPSAQAIIASTKTIPVVYSAVTDPVAAKLVKSWGPSGTNVTGASDELTISSQVDLIKKIKPNAKKIGFVYSPGEINSVTVAKNLKAELAKHGMTLVESAAPRTVDIPLAAKKLVGKVDLIYSNTDNNVVSAYETLYKVGIDNKLPLIASDPDTARRGAIAANGVNYYNLGRQTGKLVVRILKGEKPGSIPSQRANKLDLVLNAKSAAKMGVTLSPALLKQAQQVIK